MSDNSRLYFAPWERSFQQIATPFEEFLHRQTTTGVLLIFCAIIALIIANSPLLDAYDRLLHMQIGLTIGDWSILHSVHHWINDGLMAIFFFVVGMEIKREVLAGELSSLKSASLPVIAAIGGIIVPPRSFTGWSTRTVKARVAGAFSWQPTSPSRWVSLRCWEAGCPSPWSPSWLQWRLWMICARYRSSPSSIPILFIPAICWPQLVSRFC